MSFAHPAQVLVSRSYYELVTRALRRLRAAICVSGIAHGQARARARITKSAGSTHEALDLRRAAVKRRSPHSLVPAPGRTTYGSGRVRSETLARHPTLAVSWRSFRSGAACAIAFQMSRAWKPGRSKVVRPAIRNRKTLSLRLRPRRSSGRRQPSCRPHPSCQTGHRISRAEESAARKHPAPKPRPAASSPNASLPLLLAAPALPPLAPNGRRRPSRRRRRKPRS